MANSNLPKQKADSDFLFLKALIDFAKTNKWRVVVSGGYGMDFFLHKLTRSHGDLDVIIYGKENKSDAIYILDKFIIGYFSTAKIVTKPQEFYQEIDVKAKNFVANMYFVETVEDPYVNLKKVRKLNGDAIVNKITEFPLPVPGKIGNIEVEVQDQNAHLADILTRRGYDKSLSKHDPDIVTLTKITDPKKVELLLKNK